MTMDNPLSRARKPNLTPGFFAGEGWGEGKVPILNKISIPQKFHNHLNTSVRRSIFCIQM